MPRPDHVSHPSWKSRDSPPSVLPDSSNGGRQKMEVEEKFGLAKIRFQPNTEARWKIRVNDKIYVLTEISRCAA